MTQDKEENHLIEERRKKLAELRAAEKAYPNDFKRKNLAGEIKEELDQFSKEELEKKKKKVSVAGRIMLRRMMGKASFTTIQDFSGRIQLYVRADEVSNYDEFKKLLENKGGFIYAHWDGTPETENLIKEETKATVRCIPLNGNKESLMKSIF